MKFKDQQPIKLNYYEYHEGEGTIYVLEPTGTQGSFNEWTRAANAANIKIQFVDK